MTPSEWSLSEWLYNLEHRNTQEIQLGLSRILAVALQLKLISPDFKVITVGGTNGKGSTVRALETIYHTAGYKVGAYTSPHLIQFNERIRVNSLPIDDDVLCEAFNVIDNAREDINLTYFEMTTLAALWHFKQCDLDIVILEVGLGGRLDATNVVDADLSIITTIDYDHQDYLGNTLEAIGYEKAGILRAGKPFIYADINPPATVIDVAKNLAVSSYFYDQDYAIQEDSLFWNVIGLNQHINQLPRPKIQLKSAAAAIVACLLLQDNLPVSEQQLRTAMNSVFIAGRLQLDKGDVSILYDVAHNAQSAQLLAQTVKGLNIEGQVHAVFSALKDKDISGLILPLKDCVDRWYPAELDNKRASSAQMLLEVFAKEEILVKICYTSALIAFNTALNQAKVGDLIIVYGSFFTVGQIMARRFYEISNG